jgi:Fe-S cluster assembly protein SufD
VASELLESLIGGAAVAVPAERRAAAAALLRDGLPGARDEAWKYTSLRALEQRRYVDGDCGATMRAIDFKALALPGAGARLVFVNGVYRADASDLRACAGLDIGRLGERPADLALALRELDPASRTDGFQRLNGVLALDGPLLRVAAGATIEQPVHLVFIGAAAEADVAWQLRALIELGANAALRVVEHHVAADARERDPGAGTDAHLGNLVARYALGAGARLDLVQVQDAADAATLIRRSEFRLETDAMLALHTIEAGAQMMRHDLVVDLAGRGARLASRGVFALRGRQHADTHMIVTHNARDTACDIVWRGVADQRARGVFHGAITVAEGADGADAQLSNKNLLLSPHAEIDTQPVLEIYADEVKAAHGATVGQLDERALFYLRSRGVPLDLARRILVGAFCGAVLTDIAPAELRARIDALLAARLPQAETTP